MGADPIFYVPQVLFFVWAAILLGFFVKSARAEYALEGWHTPRFLWAAALCFSSFVVVLHELDPRTILGLYSPNVLRLIEWLEIISLASSFAFTGYMYLIALYQRNLNTVPKDLRNAWIALTVGFSTIHAVLSIIGASSGNAYWFGVDGFILALHEVLLTLVLNISICKLTNYLNKLNQEKVTLGVAVKGFKRALRKMMYVRVGSIGVTIFGILFQLASPGAAIDRIAAPFTPIVYDNQKFNALFIVPSILGCVLHSGLLYMLNRPQSKSEKSSDVKTTELSTVSRPSNTTFVDINSATDILPHSSP